MRSKTRPVLVRAEASPNKCIVRVLRAVERGEKREQELHNANHNAQKAPLEENAKPKPPVKINYKNYRIKALEAVGSYIKNRFAEDLLRAPDVDAKLAAMKEIIENELEYVEKHLAPCFPDEYAKFTCAIMF